MLRRLLQTMAFETKILKVDPKSILFSETAHIDGSLPTITDPETEQNLLEAARIIRDTDDTVGFRRKRSTGLEGPLSMTSRFLIYTRPKTGPVTTH